MRIRWSLQQLAQKQQLDIHMQKTKLNPYLSLHTKINPKWIVTLILLFFGKDIIFMHSTISGFINH